MLALALKRAAPAPNGLSVVHFAAESHGSRLIVKLYGDTYVRANVDVERYASDLGPVWKVDLCKLHDLPRPTVFWASLIRTCLSMFPRR